MFRAVCSYSSFQGDDSLFVLCRALPIVFREHFDGRGHLKIASRFTPGLSLLCFFFPTQMSLGLTCPSEILDGVGSFSVHRSLES